MTKTVNSLCVLIVGGLAVLSAPDAHAIPISVQYTVSVNSADPGLVVQTMDLAGNPYFDDLALGVPVSFELFRIWTDETAVNVGEDDVAKAATVLWSFFYPPGGSVSVGATFGSSLFQLGFLDAGQVTWSNPTVIDFANGAQIQISLSDETFNAASLSSIFFDLTPGFDHGANVTATMTLTRAPVPEPSSLMLLGLGLGGAWTASRRRHARQQAKSSRHS